jgi:hypothetical protein
MSGENGDGHDGHTGAVEGGEVVSLEEARRRAEERAKDAGGAPGGTTPPQAVDASGLLQPIVAAIAMELSKVADADGTVRLGGEDEVAKQKTAAVLRGIGQGLGAVLGEAFSKWAEKMVTSGTVKIDGTNVPPAPTPPTPPTTPPTTPEDPEKKN